MQITDVRVRKITKEGKMKAVVSISREKLQKVKLESDEKGLEEPEEAI